MPQYHLNDFEKQALPVGAIWKFLQGAGKTVGTKALEAGKKMVAPGVAGYRATKATGGSTARAAGRAVAEQAKATGRVAAKGVEAVKNSPAAQAAGKRVSDFTSPLSTPVGRLGQYTTDVSRNALNFGEELFNKARGNPQMFGPGGLGDRMISPTLANPRSFRNVAVGSGVLYGGARALGLTGGGSAEDSVYTPVAPGAAMPTPMPNYTPNGGGFLSGIPKEMQYAAMAGVPLALLGGYMGGGKGLGLGALGVGALGLGAAGSGYFGDDARRLVGQGANSLMGLFGGNQNGDIMSQIEQLSNLSPEFGVTMLMGKNPGISREEAEQMYHFLTQNKSTIAKMAPMVTGAQTPMAKAGALMAVSAVLDKKARCWKGYEPVPGKAPYSNGSCRPMGSKKKKNEKKAQYPTMSLGGGASTPQLVTSSSGRGPQGAGGWPAHVMQSGLDPRRQTTPTQAPQMKEVYTPPGYSPRQVGSTPTPTFSLARPNMANDLKPNLTVSGGNSRVTPVAHESAKNYAPVTQQPAPAAKTPTPIAAPKPVPKPEMTADDYSMQAKKMLAELNLRRRQAGGEVADAKQVNDQVNALLARANQMRNAPGYKPTTQGGQMVQDLNKDRSAAGGEVANAPQRMQAINAANAAYDRSSWQTANQYAASRNPQGAQIAARQDRSMGRPVQYSAPSPQQIVTPPPRRAPMQLASTKMGHAQNLEKDAVIGAGLKLLGRGAMSAGKSLVKNLPRAGAAIAAGSRRAVTGAGDVAAFVGNQAARGGKAVAEMGHNVSQQAGKMMRHVGDTAAQPDLDIVERGMTHLVGAGANVGGLGGAAMAAGGRIAQGLGRGVNLAGQGLQMAGKHTASAVPLAAAGAYGAYQAARPMLPSVNLRSPIADSGAAPSFTYNPGRAPTFQSPITVGGGASNAAPTVEDDE